MSEKKTKGKFPTTLCAALMGAQALLFAPTAQADIDDPLRLFASCAGRLSAQMEHEWLMSHPSAKQTEMRRHTMIDLISATMDADQGRQVLNWRIEAKAAHAALLTRATFRSDAWAEDRAAQMLHSCTVLLIS